MATPPKKVGFFKSIVYRDGASSSKKLWYHGACAVACVIMLYLAFTLPTDRGMEDWTFVWLFAIFMLTVGGFDVILQALKLIIEWKNGKPAQEVVEEPVPDPIVPCGCPLGCPKVDTPKVVTTHAKGKDEVTNDEQPLNGD